MATSRWVLGERYLVDKIGLAWQPPVAGPNTWHTWHRGSHLPTSEKRVIEYGSSSKGCSTTEPCKHFHPRSVGGVCLRGHSGVVCPPRFGENRCYRVFANELLQALVCLNDGWQDRDTG